MALIVENGSGLSTAESYISVADADARQLNNGMTNWFTDAMTPTVKEQVLRRATVFMEQAFRQRWRGRRLHTAQALSWPRWGLMVDGFPVSPSTVPAEIANACADLALKAAAGDLNADLTQTVLVDKVGPIETTYDRFSPQRVRYPSIEGTLAPFLNGSSASVSLVRT